jgi:CheY-like chemotaxis protein
MTPEVQAHLFEPFFTTKPRGRGTGLGLPTVYGIVKQSGGHISVYSEPGIGTTFRIYLPVAPPDAAEAPVIPEKATSKPAALTGNETILVVEDNPLLRRLNEQILNQYGYRVLIAGDGAQAQRLCNDYDGPIHVVIMDVVMPGESGPVVGEWIAQKRNRTKIIYMSGYAGEGLDRNRILASGSVFLQKPFTGAQLARAIRDVLAS